jgi:hypothetical protein
MCQIPSHITEGLTATPFVLVRCLRGTPMSRSISASSAVYGTFTTPKYLSRYECSPTDFLGPTGFGNEGGSNGLLTERRGLAT